MIRLRKPSGDVQYTCPMHPQVVKDEMGECPICHMDLVPVNNVVADTAQHEHLPVDTIEEQHNENYNCANATRN